MNMRGTDMLGIMVAVHRMVLRFTRSLIVDMNHGSGAVDQKTVGCRHAGKRQRDCRRQDTQQIEQRNGAACSQSLGPDESQVDRPWGWRGQTHISGKGNFFQAGIQGISAVA